MSLIFTPSVIYAIAAMIVLAVLLLRQPIGRTPAPGTTRRLLSRPRAVWDAAKRQAYADLETAINAVAPGHRVFADMPVGSFLAVETRDDTARDVAATLQRIGDIEVDYLVVDDGWAPVAVLATPADDRDPDTAAITRGALSAAGVDYIPLPAQGVTADLIDRLTRGLRPQAV